MSVTKNRATKYHETTQDVKFKISEVRIQNAHNKAETVINVSLRGVVGATDGEVDRIHANLTIDEVLASFSASEKGAAKMFLKALEREAALKVAELSTEPQDDTDVFA